MIGTAAGSVLSAAALSIGQKLFKVNYYPNGKVVGGVTVGQTGTVWQDFGNNLAAFGANAAVGSVSSYLAGEFVQALGVHGTVGQFLQMETGNVLGYLATDALANSGWVGNFLDPAAATNVGGALTSGIAGFIGTQLASLIVSPHTTAEATLASLGSAVGVIAGSTIAHVLGIVGAAAGPVGAAIGAFVGFILGDLIGSLFGHHKPRIPGASAETVLQIPYARYGLGAESAVNGGDLGFAEQMASAAKDTLNGIIAQVTGKPVGASFVANGYSPTQTYGYSGGQVYVKLGGVQQNVSSADQAVDAGVLWALPQTRIIGGDLFLKRAIANGRWQTVTELLGDLQIAADYESYLKNEAVVDAAISASWNGLAQGDKDFYAANQAFMTRALAAAQLPLSGGDVGFYQANRAQVDRIVAGTQVSSFAAGWITTIARATELGLDKIGASDFYGGLAGFLQSVGVTATGSAEHYEDMKLLLRDGGTLALSAGGAAATGLFAGVPGHLDGAPGDDVYNPRFQQGIAGWSFAYNTAAGWGVDLSNNVDWWGSGNDAVWSSMVGTPAAGSLADIYSDLMPAVAGHRYEASVEAAQHRGQASLVIEYLDANKALLASVPLAAGGVEGGSHDGLLANYALLQGSAAAPAGTVWRRLILRNTATGGASPYAFFTRPESHDVTSATDLANPRFLGNLAGWTLATNLTPAQAGDDLNADWSGSGNDVLFLHMPGTTAQGSLADLRSELIGAQAGQSYSVSVLAAQHRGQADVYVEWLDAGLNDIGYTAVPGHGRALGGYHGDPATFDAIQGTVTAPAGAAYRKLLLRLEGQGADDAYAFFTQPLFTPYAGGPAPSWAASPSDYAAGAGANWDAAGTSLAIANFASAAGYSVNAFTSGNDLIDAHDWTINTYLDDTISGTGEGGDDVFLTGPGNDVVYGRSGNDWLDGGAGNDTLIGGTGDDVLLGQAGDDILQGDEGADYLAGGDGADALYGGAGNDVLVGGAGADMIFGEGGDDTFIIDEDGGATLDRIDGGAGIDTASFERFHTGLTVDLSGQAGADAVATLPAGAVLTAGQSLSVANGYATLVYQQDGNLVLYSAAGAIWASGTYNQPPGRVVMQGDGNLVIYNAFLQPVWASGTVGSNATRLVLDDTGALQLTRGDGGVIWSVGGGGAPSSAVTWVYGDEWVSIENITGSNYDDVLRDTDYGGTLKGLAGNDRLSGGSGNDILEGGAGADQLYGGTGSDTASYTGSAAGVYASLDTAEAKFDAAYYLQANPDVAASGADPYQHYMTWGWHEGRNPNAYFNTNYYLAANPDVAAAGANPFQHYLDNGRREGRTYAAALGGTTAIGGDATGDQYSSIENLSGSAFADELAGDGGANAIDGGAGDDWIDGSAGADIINGGDGVDTLDYSQSGLSSVYVDLAFDHVLAYGASASWTQTVTSVDHFIGTAANDTFSNVSRALNVTFDGDGGNDTYYGGSGSDTYVLGPGYGVSTVSDSNAATNVVSIGEGVTFNDLGITNNNGTMQVELRQGGKLLIANNFQSGNDVIKTLDVGGVAQVDLTQLNGGVNLTESADSWSGDVYNSQIIFGLGGDDTISASGYALTQVGSIVDGGAGNDRITTSQGDDQFLFERGDGTDYIFDDGGRNTIVFGSTVAADDVIYKVVNNGVSSDLWVGIKDLNNPNLDASQVGDHLFIANGATIIENVQNGLQHFATAFSIQAGGVTTDLTKANLDWYVQYYNPGTGGGGGGGNGGIPPIILDLTGDGLELAPVATSNIVTTDGAGNLFRTSWVGPDNGILAYDRSGDGQLNQSADISFIGDKPGATGDLDGLSGWDTNGDGVLDARDANFGKLLVWVDANVDGRAEAGEARSLAELGIASIDLHGKPTGFDASDTFDSVVNATTRFTRTDGTSGTAYDVTLARQLLDGEPAVAAASSGIDLSAPVTIGELSSAVVDAAVTNTVAGPQKRGVFQTLTENPADFSAVGSTSVSTAAATLWADYLDPAKIAARKYAQSHGGVSSSATTGALVAPGAGTIAGSLTGRAKPDTTTRLQAMVIDFDHDGPSLIDPSASSAKLDVAHDGIPLAIGWVSSTDGILAYDHDGDGMVDPANDINFIGAAPNSRTAVQGLAAFDSNGDGVLDARDTSFAGFLIWRDANGDGQSQRPELQTLAQAGVASLQLTGAQVRSDFIGGAGNDVLGVTSITFVDGSVRGAYDVALGFAGASSNTVDNGTALEGVASAKPDAITSASIEPMGTTSGHADVDTASAPAPNGHGVGTVAASHGALDGPEGQTVSLAPTMQATLAWWRDPAIVGDTLAALGMPLDRPDGSLGANLGSPVAAGLDAASLQRQQLLRQSMATLQPASGGSAAIWARAANDQGTILAAANSSGQTLIPPAVAARG